MNVFYFEGNIQIKNALNIILALKKYLILRIIILQKRKFVTRHVTNFLFCVVDIESQKC